MAIEVTYVFIISAGTFTAWSTWNTNYDLEAEGFRAGHLYIPVAPSPELLAKPNPYDWGNSSLWFWDASLYKGHYYLYWGPLPALALLAAKVALRIHVPVGDQYPLFASYTLFLVAGALLIDRMTRRLFPRLPRSLALLGVATFAYAMPTPYMVATPGIYEAAIAAAQALLLLGLLFAFDAVWAEAGPPARWRLLAAGAAWGAAVACRVTAVLPAGAFVLLTALLLAPRGERRWRRALADAAWVGGPVAVWLAGLAAYDKARFDSWFEVGLKYQLNTLPLVSSRAYLPFNIFSYLLRPVGTSCRFPFVSALYDIGARGFPAGVHLPPGYWSHEPQAGLFVTAPFAALSLVAAVFVGRRLVGWWRAGRRAFALDRRRRAELWCLASFAALALLMPLPFIAAFDTTMRYLGDFATGTVLLAVWGAWSLLDAARVGWPRRAVCALLIGLAAVTIGIGILLGFSGYDEMFKQHNRPLYDLLRHRLSFCG
ncbi:MAG TPA: hypothetical protein VHO06_20170 [Polyangia bacterium]|nr:hypothetical protein [Polyangia bacterium]